ncbi:MAG: diaminopimelate decarboxylase, partial [Acidimicrobiia bacterium]|nr:diaminopimelate decarboxylase [Acidimicrobiia bacterium]
MTYGPIPAHLLPDTAQVVDGRLHLGGCNVVELAEEYGTPLFVYDEEHLRARCREAVAAFPDGVAYATKAFLSQAMARVAHEEGMQLDVATGGELHVVLEAGVPPDHLVMHGNNKSVEELRAALDADVGRVVVDSFDELDRIEQLVNEGATAPRVLIRVNPGVDAHTHEYLQTGVPDSKFGFGIASGDAAAALARARTSPLMELVGVHAHIGSQVFVVDSFRRAIGVLAPFLAEHELAEISIGGG